MEDVLIINGRTYVRKEDEVNYTRTKTPTDTTWYAVRGVHKYQAPKKYSGHGENTGGLQKHSVGEFYPYYSMVVEVPVDLAGTLYPLYRVCDSRDSGYLTFSVKENQLYCMSLLREHGSPKLTPGTAAMSLLVEGP